MDRIDRAGALAVVAFAALAAVGAAQGWSAPDGAPGAVGSPADDPTASLVEAWAATRTLEHRSVGTFEREATDGTRLIEPTEVVQRPPDRLLRQFGQVSGRRDERELSCPAPLDGSEPACHLGPPGPDFAAVVEQEIESFRDLVDGPDPLYEVARLDGRCWRMTRTRYDPRSGYGQHAELCFDPGTGALRSVAVDHGAIDETTEFHTITTVVSDADLEP